MVRTQVGRIDDTINGIDYTAQDSAGSFNTFIDTCQTTSLHYTDIAAQRIANGNLPANYFDYAGSLVSETFDEVAQRLVRTVDFDSEGQYTQWRTWMHELALDSAGKTFFDETESLVTSTV